MSKRELALGLSPDVLQILQEESAKRNQSVDRLVRGSLYCLGLVTYKHDGFALAEKIANLN